MERFRPLSCALVGFTGAQANSRAVLQSLRCGRVREGQIRTRREDCTQDRPPADFLLRSKSLEWDRLNESPEWVRREVARPERGGEVEPTNGGAGEPPGSPTSFMDSIEGGPI